MLLSRTRRRRRLSRHRSLHLTNHVISRSRICSLRPILIIIEREWTGRDCTEASTQSIWSKMTEEELEKGSVYTPALPCSCYYITKICIARTSNMEVFGA